MSGGHVATTERYAALVAQRWLEKTKPPGSLGMLEAIAAQLGTIQHTDAPVASPAALLLFAGDHGVHEEGVSPYPQAVTAQMAVNIATGGAASSVLAALHHIDYRVFDVGIATATAAHDRLESRNVRRGTRNLRHEDAMTRDEAEAAITVGREAVQQFAGDAKVLIVGEMGIGNTTSAAALCAALLGSPASEWVGAGTGANADGIALKARVVTQAIARRSHQTPLDVLCAVGGLEIAAMVGAYLEGAARRQLLLIDGFIATTALLVAARIEPSVLKACVFSHCSEERGHRALLTALGAEPLLSLGMRLGEASGALVAYPLLLQSCELLQRMATFSQAAVTNRA